MAPPKMVSAIGLGAVELKLTVGLRAHFTYPTDDLLLIYFSSMIWLSVHFKNSH